MQLAILDYRSATGDGGVHVAVPGQVAHRTAVDTALDRLQLVDDLHRTHLGRPGEGAGGQDRAQCIHRRQRRLELAGDVGDDVHDVGVAFDDHFLGQPNRAVFSNTTDVVAAQVDQHQVLGQFLGVTEQVLL